MNDPPPFSFVEDEDSNQSGDNPLKTSLSDLTRLDLNRIFFGSGSVAKSAANVGGGQSSVGGGQPILGNQSGHDISFDLDVLTSAATELNESSLLNFFQEIQNREKESCCDVVTTPSNQLNTDIIDEHSVSSLPSFPAEHVGSLLTGDPSLSASACHAQSPLRQTEFFGSSDDVSSSSPFSFPHFMSAQSSVSGGGVEKSASTNNFNGLSESGVKGKGDGVHLTPQHHHPSSVGGAMTSHLVWSREENLLNTFLTSMHDVVGEGGEHLKMEDSRLDASPGSTTVNNMTSASGSGVPQQLQLQSSENLVVYNCVQCNKCYERKSYYIDHLKSHNHLFTAKTFQISTSNYDNSPTPAFHILQNTAVSGASSGSLYVSDNQHPVVPQQQRVSTESGNVQGATPPPVKMMALVAVENVVKKKHLIPLYITIQQGGSLFSTTQDNNIFITIPPKFNPLALKIAVHNFIFLRFLQSDFFKLRIMYLPGILARHPNGEALDPSKRVCRWMINGCGVICGKVFQQWGSLRLHVESQHCNIKPHACHLCEKSYIRKDYLDRHIKDFHEHPSSGKPPPTDGVKKEVDESSKTCVNKSGTSEGVSAKTKDMMDDDAPPTTSSDAPTVTKLFCDWIIIPPKNSSDVGVKCMRSFTQAKSLRRHISENHYMHRPYTCKICHLKSYGRLDYLKRHIEIAHGSKKAKKKKEEEENNSVVNQKKSSSSVCPSDDGERSKCDDVTNDKHEYSITQEHSSVVSGTCTISASDLQSLRISPIQPHLSSHSPVCDEAAGIDSSVNDRDDESYRIVTQDHAKIDKSTLQDQIVPPTVIPPLSREMCGGVLRDFEVEDQSKLVSSHELFTGSTDETVVEVASKRSSMLTGNEDARHQVCVGHEGQRQGGEEGLHINSEPVIDPIPMTPSNNKRVLESIYPVLVWLKRHKSKVVKPVAVNNNNSQNGLNVELSSHGQSLFHGSSLGLRTNIALSRPISSVNKKCYVKGKRGDRGEDSSKQSGGSSKRSHQYNNKQIFQPPSPNPSSSTTVERVVHRRFRKPVRCSYIEGNGIMCGRVFSKAMSLRRHMSEIHERRRPFQCEMCEKCYGRKDYLLRHVNNIHHEIHEKSDESSNSLIQPEG